MTFNIKLDIIDLSKKYRFFEIIYSCLGEYGYYSGTVIINYLDDTYNEMSFNYINDPSITISVFDSKSNKSGYDIEHLYYFIRSIVRESENNILNVELKFIKNN